MDRRLRELEPAERKLLALIGHSRQPLWGLGNLIEMMIALGEEDGLRPVFSLLEAGLLYPHLADEEGASPSASAPRSRVLRSFEQWLAFAGPETLRVFAHPLALARAVGEGTRPGRVPRTGERQRPGAGG